MSTDSSDQAPKDLPPPPPIPLNVTPHNVTPAKFIREKEWKKPLLVPMARPGLRSKGNKVSILTNHFKVNVTNLEGHFYHYSVALFYEDSHPVNAKGIGRNVLEQLRKTYATELEGMEFAYDGAKSLFTVGPLRGNKLEFNVVIESVTSSRNKGNSSPGDDVDKLPYQSKTYKVEISYAGKIPMQAVANSLRGQELENSQEALRVLDIVLSQHAARQGCLLARQSFFDNDAKNFDDFGGGVLGCRGFHSSFRTTQSGLSLNIDVSTALIIKPGPLVEFLVANQNVRDHFSIDWAKAKRTLKNLRITVSPSNQEHKITGLSDRPCKDQQFTLKQKNDGGEIEVSIYDYFVKHRKIDLRYSENLPCINVGKPKRPTYIPVELCSLVSLQRYTKSLTNLQRASIVEKSWQEPKERMSALSNALETNNYAAEPMLKSGGVSISSSFTEVEGRVLPTPKLIASYSGLLHVRNGRWNFNDEIFANPSMIKDWAVVNFSAQHCDTPGLIEDLKRIRQSKAMGVEDPFCVFNEDPQFRQGHPMVRVEKMYEQIHATLPYEPKFLLCVPPEKNCDVYGPWKRKSLCDFGVVTQCLAPTRVDDQYLTNLLMKINAKLGGLNSLLAGEIPSSLPVVSRIPTLILGMHVSHGSPGRSDVPSIAAVVSSKQWPWISHYRATVRTQSPKLEMIDSLYQRVSDTQDDGIMRELLLDFYVGSGKRKPGQIIIFRDGVSESQFNKVLNIELRQIIEACNFLDAPWKPKFTVIIAQKNHHTRFFLPNSPDNVQPGTIIDNKVCHPRNYDFYLCAHAGRTGTTRPTHYHVLLDEAGISPNELQKFVHNLCYVSQRSTTTMSVVAPIYYAHLAARQLGQWMKYEEASETSSSHAVPPMPKLHEKVRNSMFFC